VTGPGFQRLSAQDASFLFFEGPATPMHVAALALFEGGPLLGADGGIDAGRLEKYVESRLHRLPRYRQRLVFTPVTGHPVWVDDGRFQLGYHLRRVALPRPGDEAALAELVGRVLSQALDREKPLWEMWVVEGLCGGRFALLSKIHHCMVDGVSGANLLTLLFSASPAEPVEAVPRFAPRPEPSPAWLLVHEALRQARQPLDLLAAARAALAAPRRSLEAAAEDAAALGEALAAGLRLPAPTPLNRPIGPYRRVAWRRTELARVKAVKNRLGGTVNDVVLATVAGALQHFLGEARAWRARFDYRVVVPVNVRPPGDDFSAANRVSAFFLSLPVAEPDPLRRHARIREETERLKASRAARGMDLWARLADGAGSTLLTRFGVGLATALRPYHLIVTNVPGPQMPLYVLGARLLELYPLLPLFERQGLGVAVLSYDGGLGFGLTADRELLPDLGRFAVALDESLSELVAAATPRSRRRGAPPRAPGARSVPGAASSG
jgi:WS/DGAT/MGAT family acyltransferase